MKRSITLLTLASAVLMAACSGPVSPTGAPSANAGTLASPEGGNGVTSQPAAVPFKGNIEGTQSVTPLAFPFLAVNGSGSGSATLLGQFTVHFPHTVNLTTRIGVGTYTFTAASGDTLTADFTGQANGTGLVSIEEQATVTGGTGRFDGATGTFTVLREFDQSAGVTSGTFEGSLVLARAGHP